MKPERKRKILHGTQGYIDNADTLQAKEEQAREHDTGIEDEDREQSGQMDNEIVGMNMPGLAITDREIREARQIFEKYKQGRTNLEQRIVENENWYKLNHWRNFEKKVTNPNAIQSTSAWLFNSINNKHADFMDNYPSPNVLPKESSDEDAAKALTSIIPVILEDCDFEQVYSDNSTEKLKNGCGIYGVFFNPRKNRGLGDIDIKVIDILNIFWEPGKEYIQDSKNLFVLSMIDNDTLKGMYPELSEKIGKSETAEVKKYNYDDDVDTTDKSVIFDWYYKKYDGVKEVLHYVKFVDDHVLYASENDPEYKENGYYHHGQYPFVFDTLFKEKGTPCGFGYIDIMKSPQEYIDKLNQAILANAQWACRPRHFIRDNADINETEFTDLNKDFVHVAGSGMNLNESIKAIETVQLGGNYLNVLQMKIDELKETSGNRDFSQGATTAGVTAASAIAALQEAGSKTSRDMIKASYRSFTKICAMVIELIRQFYDEIRIFRIVGDNGETEYAEFNNAILKPQGMETQFGLELSEKEPTFDIKVKAQKNSPYAREAQNELAIQLYQMGFFNPELAPQALAVIEMMEFEGKEKVKELVMNNHQQMIMAQREMQMRQAQENLQNISADPMRTESQSTPQGGGTFWEEEDRLTKIREQSQSTTGVR